MGIAYIPFLDSETGGAHRNNEVAELLKFWTERIVEIDAVEKEGPSLGLILEKTPDSWTERIVEIDAVEKEGPSLGLILE